jgi:hypothetical protein
MPRNAHLSLAFAHVGRGQARIIVEVEARACPLRQLQETPSDCFRIYRPSNVRRFRLRKL